MLKKSLLILTVLLVSLSLMAMAAHLVILEINDTHGHAWAYNEWHNPNIGGFAAIASVVNQVRAEAKANGWDVLFLHAGDVNTGVPESDLLDARPDIEALNAMGLDAMAIGNHEFDHPWSILMRQMTWANFPFLSANVVYKGTDETLGEPYIIKTFPDLKVAILGLTTKTTEYVGNPNNVKMYDFLSPIKVAKKYVPMLHTMMGQNGVVLALTHLGIFGNGLTAGSKITNSPATIKNLLAYNKPNDPYGGSVSLAESVKGIAAILDGHSHTIVEQPLNIDGTLIVQAGSFSKYVARLDLIIKDGKVTSYTYKLIPINLKVYHKDKNGKVTYTYVGKKIIPDKKIQDLLAAYKAIGEKKLNEPIGYSKVNFSNKGEITRKEDSLIGHLITDAVAWKFKDQGIQAVLQNGGGIRASIAPGTITYRDILTVLPFGNTVVLLKIKGSDLIKAIQWGAMPHANDTGARLNPWGLTYVVTPKGVKDIKIQGKPIDPNKVYLIATNDYMASGGDHYSMLKNCEQYNTNYVLADVVKEYIEHISPINSYPFKPRWTMEK
ncbi:5'-nucleotidase C-terminal domain-containing protein [Mesoaciditoga sp.]